MKKTLKMLFALAMVLSLVFAFGISAFAVETATVSFEMSGFTHATNSNVPEDQTKAIGSKVDNPGLPGSQGRKAGAIDGWCTKDGAKWDFDNDTVKGDMTLYAYEDFNYLTFGQAPNGDYFIGTAWSDMDSDTGNHPYAFLPCSDLPGCWVEKPAKAGDLPVLHLTEDFAIPSTMRGLVLLCDCIVDVGSDTVNLGTNELLIWDGVSLTLRGTGTLNTGSFVCNRYRIKPDGWTEGQPYGYITVDGGIHINVFNPDTNKSGLSGDEKYQLKLISGVITATTTRNVFSGISKFMNLASYFNNPNYIVSGSLKSEPTAADWTTAVTFDSTSKNIKIGEALAKTVRIERAYPVRIGDTENGSVTASPQYATADAEVALTVTPAEGYALKAITAKDAKGQEIKLTAAEDGKTYTFTMPASNVTVDADFAFVNIFKDITETNYYYDAVLWATENKITYGVDDTHFAPYNLATRAQFITMLWRAAGCPGNHYNVTFVDVNNYAYYGAALAWAVENGIIYGVDKFHFAPDKAVTRGEAVAMMWRADGSHLVHYKIGFNDVPADAWYTEAIRWAMANDITYGTSEDTFSPNGFTTRAHAVTFLYRAFQAE